MRGYHHRRTRRENAWCEQLVPHIHKAMVDRGLSNAQIASLLGVSRHSKLREDLATIRRGEPCAIGRMLDIADVLRLPLVPTLVVEKAAA